MSQSTEIHGSPSPEQRGARDSGPRPIADPRAGERALPSPLTAWDAHKIVFGLQMGFVCSAGVGILDGRRTADNESLIELVVLLWTLVCLDLFLGGVGRMLGNELSDRALSRLRAAWAFVARRGFSVLIGTAIPSAIVIALLVGLATLAHGIAGSGPNGLAGAAATLPVFFGFFLIVPFLFHCHFVPVVMGVEDCGAGAAWRRLAGKSPFETLDTLLAVLAESIPHAVGAAVFFAALAAATFAATTPNMSWDAIFGQDPSGAVRRLSYVMIAYSWLAYSAVKVALSFAMRYSAAGR